MVMSKKFLYIFVTKEEKAGLFSQINHDSQYSRVHFDLSTAYVLRMHDQPQVLLSRPSPSSPNKKWSM